MVGNNDDDADDVDDDDDVDEVLWEAGVTDSWTTLLFQLSLTRLRGGPIGGICWVASARNASAIRCGWLRIMFFQPTVSITSVGWLNKSNKKLSIIRVENALEWLSYVKSLNYMSNCHLTKWKTVILLCERL